MQKIVLEKTASSHLRAINVAITDAIEKASRILEKIDERSPPIGEATH